MKRLCLSAMSLLLVAFSVSDAAPTLTIISEIHTVWGYADPDSYALSDTVPVSGSAFGENLFDEASSSAGDFSVEAYTRFLSFGAAVAYAESTYLFETLEGGVTLSFTGAGRGGGGGFESQAGFSFYDVTGGFEIDSHLWEGVWGQYPTYWTADLEQFYTIDPSHQYQLRLWADCGGEGTSCGYESVLNAAIQAPIPAPGAVVLGCVGVVCVTWLRRRRTLKPYCSPSVR